MAKKIMLSCNDCGSRNYSVPARNNNPSERLTLKKFCKHCKSHTVHKQTA